MLMGYMLLRTRSMDHLHQNHMHMFKETFQFPTQDLLNQTPREG